MWPASWLVEHWQCGESAARARACMQHTLAAWQAGCSLPLRCSLPLLCRPRCVADPAALQTPLHSHALLADQASSQHDHMRAPCLHDAHHVCILQVLYTSTAIGGVCPPSPPLPPSTKAALIAIQSATTSAWPTGLSSWAYDTEPCNPPWQGVTCSGSTVTGVDISYYSLAVSGACMHAQWCAFSSQAPTLGLSWHPSACHKLAGAL